MIKMKFGDSYLKLSKFNKPGKRFPIGNVLCVEGHIPDLKLCFRVKKTSILNGGFFHGGV